MNNDIIPFDVWPKKNSTEFMQKEGTCNQCDGSGITECRCCGSEIDCELCNGTGRIAIDEAQVDVRRALAAYEASVARDKGLLATLAAWSA